MGFLFTLRSSSLLSGGKQLISLDMNNGFHTYCANFSNFICTKLPKGISSAPATVRTLGECGQSGKVSPTRRKLFLVSIRHFMPIHKAMLGGLFPCLGLWAGAPLCRKRQPGLSQGEFGWPCQPVRDWLWGWCGVPWFWSWLTLCTRLLSGGWGCVWNTFVLLSGSLLFFLFFLFWIGALVSF